MLAWRLIPLLSSIQQHLQLLLLLRVLCSLSSLSATLDALPTGVAGTSTYRLVLRVLSWIDGLFEDRILRIHSLRYFKAVNILLRIRIKVKVNLKVLTIMP